MILLVAAVVAGISVVAVPSTVTSGISNALCRVPGGEECAGADKSAGPSASATPGTVSGAAPGATPQGVPTLPGSAEQQAYDLARLDADSADRAVQGAEREFSAFQGELITFLEELIGLTAAKKCLGRFEIMACIESAADLIPWGKAFKLLRKLPKAYKLVQRFMDLWEKISGAREKRERAAKALREAGAKLKKKADETRKRNPPLACAVGPGRRNSFVPGTPVLMATGTHKPIERIRIDDRVWASDSVTGLGGPRPVTGLITGYGTKHLVDVTVGGRGVADGATAVVTATDEHPFWVAGTRTWTRAEDLAPGDRLTIAGGGSVAVVSTREYDRVQRVHNLTVGGLHTYHVGAGLVDLLVHNDCEKELPNRESTFKQTQEVKSAAARGVRAVTLADGAGMDALHRALNGATDFKWAIVPNGRGGMELRVAPAYWKGSGPGDLPDIEIAHTVLAGVDGKVFAAGSGNFMGDMLFINNHSGHFKPGASTLPLGEEFFRRAGIDSIAIPVPGS
ncbi:polymorphic toxin-type HINT domain-containing protein [Actinomadura sp. HBU206391]|uniref:polymorphic toxin-type HINT domain-containing protein n=1 Tax=Actinomadura sp. HBU206391 TaxID=2731692 RepID=UPI001650CC62|nr:polymorphic toxin-type HINT domain-containing protein [Actinomadura sp. HBU206391]MBC6459520.1 hypothetical protein [Actinomadura sp. HBU206391]